MPTCYAVYILLKTYTNISPGYKELVPDTLALLKKEPQLPLKPLFRILYPACSAHHITKYAHQAELLSPKYAPYRLKLLLPSLYPTYDKATDTILSPNDDTVFHLRLICFVFNGRQNGYHQIIPRY